MAVYVHGVGHSCGVVENYSGGLVAAKIIQIPIVAIGISRVAFVCQEIDWIVVVDTERGIVNRPEEMTR